MEVVTSLAPMMTALGEAIGTAGNLPDMMTLYPVVVGGDTKNVLHQCVDDRGPEIVRVLARACEDTLETVTAVHEALQ